MISKKIESRRRKWNIEKWKKEHDQFAHEMSNQIQVKTKVEDIEKEWDNLKSEITSTTEKILGVKGTEKQN